MDVDPHTIQQILQRIEQQMRCPQCGKKIPVNLHTIQVIAEGCLLIQVQCEGCDAHIVLQASLQGIENISAPPYEEDKTTNASTGLSTNHSMVKEVREELSKGRSFEEMFGTVEEEAKESES